MGSKEEDALHYEIDSDNEPPHDEVGDMITVVKKGQVTKEILETGQGLGKPGRPYEVLIDYTAKFSDGQIFDEGTNVSLTLGDEAVPYGLWKAIEHMRKGEKSLIMVKPKHAFGRPEGQDYLQWPKGWESEEQKEILRKRRVYYIVKLYEWAVKHDLDGDGMLIKNILERGVGYDRPFEVDEVKLDLKIYQTLNDGTEKVYMDMKGLETVIQDHVNIWNTTRKILQSMKTKERVKTLVRPDYFIERDAEVVEKYEILKDRPLRLDIEMVNLVRVEDLYKDGSAFQKTVFKGEGTASPYSDFQVLLKIEVDGVTLFEHPRMDDLSQIEVGVDSQKYDLELYTLPPVVRKILKTTKLTETFQVRVVKSGRGMGKLAPYFEEKHEDGSASCFAQRDVIANFKNEVIYTICLVAMEQKDYLFKLTIQEKLERLSFIKAIGTDFFKRGNMKKALKLYGKVHSYFRTKDAKNNFQKEDETTEEFKGKTAELDVINKTTLTNMCVIHARGKEWKEVIRYADEALMTDPLYVKALYHKGRAQLELTEYALAIETLVKANTLEPENADVKRELARADLASRTFKDKEAKMFQKMFSE
ncbi:hypothetical protein FGO68_gene3643 [Halteria grandinella]|uniref:peptidylprolyl isomerase n=1 Tax=Halteria grandinella TaxID=5974 RepID=A0A8J8P4E4_HALGN|nr:hypothetical protein FGO68_gene3643 [Halteria grandinella]